MRLSPLLLAVSIATFPSCSRSSSTPADAGYVVPTLTGWQPGEPSVGEVNRNTTTYTKTVGANRIKMMFKLIPTRDGEKPDDAAALNHYAGAGLAIARNTSPSLKVLEQKETTFRGFPAYLTRTQDKFRDAQRERKILRVADGKNTFVFDQTLIGDPITPAARAEADDAWNKMASELNIPDGS